MWLALQRESHGGESGMTHVDARGLKLFVSFTWSLMACICWHAQVRPALAPVGVGRGVMIVMGIGQWWHDCGAVVPGYVKCVNGGRADLRGSVTDPHIPIAML